MTTIEHSIEQWAQEKRRTLSMTEQESVRIWNVIQSQIEILNPGYQTSSSKYQVASIVRSLLRWSMVPVAAMALLVMTTIFEHQNDDTTVPQPLPVVSIEQNAEMNNQPIVEEDAAKSVQHVQEKAVRPRVQTRVLYAARNQSVFVAWGSSVFTPRAASSATEMPRAVNVFSEL